MELQDDFFLSPQHVQVLFYCTEKIIVDHSVHILPFFSADLETSSVFPMASFALTEGLSSFM